MPAHIVTVEQVSEWLSVKQPSEMPLLHRLLESVERQVYRLCGRNVGPESQHGFLTGSKVEYFDGNHGYALTLRYVPVTAVASVVVIAGESSSTTLTLSRFQVDGLPLDGSAIEAHNGILQYRHGAGAHALFEFGVPLGILEPWSNFGGGKANIRVTYTGGYAATAMPLDLQQAVLDMVEWKYKQRRKYPVTPDSAVQAREGATPIGEFVSPLLQPYIRRVMA